jgi:MFS transporter, PAT family, beta-lactamase induction signal transducer AmpG
VRNAIRLWTSRRLWVTLGLGFSSGLPLGLGGATLEAWYTNAGLNIALIGALTLVGQPYVLKFLWSPALDKIRFPWLSMRRDWILATQILLIVCLLWMSFQDPLQSPLLLGFSAVLLAIASSTQDMAIDAYRTELLKPEERGLGAAMYVGGYRLAMLVSGGGSLVLAHFLGFQTVYAIMAGVMCGTLAITKWAPMVSMGSHKVTLRWRQVFVEPWREWISRPQALLILLFIIIYKLADAFSGSLITVFLLKGLSFSLAEVGWMNKVVGLIATLMGAFLGGLFLSRYSLYRALMLFGILQGASNAAYWGLAWLGEANITLATEAIFIENLCAGMGTSAFVALLMSLCHPQYAATQFALFTALSAVGRVWVGPVAGYMVTTTSWSYFFAWSIFIAVPGLLLLRLLKKRLN